MRHIISLLSCAKCDRDFHNHNQLHIHQMQQKEKLLISSPIMYILSSNLRVLYLLTNLICIRLICEGVTRYFYSFSRYHRQDELIIRTTAICRIFLDICKKLSNQTCLHVFLNPTIAYLTQYRRGEKCTISSILIMDSNKLATVTKSCNR